jgi:hypothetical protein
MRMHVLILVCLLFTSSLVEAVEYRTLKPSVDEMTRQFEAVVFGTEFQNRSRITRIKKWVGPLRVAVKTYIDVPGKDDAAKLKFQQIAVNPIHLAYVQKHLSTLARLTGLETEDFKTTQKSANYTIKIVPGTRLTDPDLVKAVNPKLLRKVGAQGGCYFLTWHNDDTGHIERVEIIVNADRSNVKTEHCLLEEMAQSLGLFNDVRSDWNTIFSNTDPIHSRSSSNQVIVSLPRPDRIIIKALYDRRLKPDMEREKVMALARKIIGEIDRTMP